MAQNKPLSTGVSVRHPASVNAHVDIMSINPAPSQTVTIEILGWGGDQLWSNPTSVPVSPVGPVTIGPHSHQSFIALSRLIWIPRRHLAQPLGRFARVFASSRPFLTITLFLMAVIISAVGLDSEAAEPLTANEIPGTGQNPPIDKFNYIAASSSGTTPVIVGHSVNGVINPLDRGVSAKCDGTTDDAPAIQLIVDAIPATDPAGGDIVFPPAVVCAIGKQITVNSKNALRIMGTGGDTDSSGSGSKGGTQFKWIGPHNAVMFEFFNVRRTTFSGFTLDANGRSNVTGILWNGNNQPPSSYNEFRNLAVYNAHIGMQIGTAATGCGPSTGCELDNTTIDTLRVFGNTSDTTSEGLLINSSNALQNSTINKFVGQNLNRGIDIQSAGGLFTISNAAIGGAPLGTNPTGIFVGAYGATPNIFQFEDEGPWTYSVHDLSAVSGVYPVLWYGNQFNNSILIDGSVNPVTSIANATQSPNATFVVGSAIPPGTAKVVSIGDTINWNAAGPGTFLQIGANFPLGGVYGFEFTIGGSAGTGSLVFNSKRGGPGIFSVDSHNKAVTLFSTTNAELGTPPNGSLVYCADCIVANPCASGGTGAIAKRLGGIWVCN